MAKRSSQRKRSSRHSGAPHHLTSGKTIGKTDKIALIVGIGICKEAMPCRDTLAPLRDAPYTLPAPFVNRTHLASSIDEMSSSVAQGQRVMSTIMSGCYRPFQMK